jgi:FkbM family methyltransferase
MTVYAVERLKQYMDCHLNQVLTPLVTNTDLYEKVADWLADKPSYDAYHRELFFMGLRLALQSDEIALREAGNVSRETWARALEQAEQLRRNGALPTLDYPASPDWLAPSLAASIFVLEQYRYGEEVRVNPGDVFVDGGGGGGEASLWAQRAGAGRCFCFEPSPLIFSYMRRNVEQLAPTGAIVALQLGLGERGGFMSVTPGPTVGQGQLAPEGEGGMRAPVTSLDEWCEKCQVRPDFIKLNLGGAEGVALAGARKVIAEFKPRLAVCINNSLADMGIIPSLIKSLEPNYRLWCKKGSVCTGFILFAAI